MSSTLQALENQVEKALILENDQLQANKVELPTVVEAVRI